jgi:uncharacterized protein
MRGLFALLFGAGALIFLSKRAAGSDAAVPPKLYFRRTLWLIVFGLIDAYVLLWEGDILFYYGVTGILLFFFRNLSARRLILCAVIAFGIQTVVTTVEWARYRDARIEAEQAWAARDLGQPLTYGQRAALDTLSAMDRGFKPDAASQQAFIAEIQDSYRSAFGALLERTWRSQTSFFVRHGLMDSLAVMLIGMALFRIGVLTGAAPTSLYLRLMLIGYAVGLTVNLIEVERLVRTEFAVGTLIGSYLTYDLGRTPLTLGHVALIALVCRANLFPAALRRLADVGRMALTNYLAHSLIALFLFTGAGLALFGELRRHQLYYVVLAVWIVQIAGSGLWLKRFRFGPAEWVWRSLTYWRPQPMRREHGEQRSLAAG